MGSPEQPRTTSSLSFLKAESGTQTQPLHEKIQRCLSEEKTLATHLESQRCLEQDPRGPCAWLGPQLVPWFRHDAS